ncbi:ATP-dependent Clp protease proteolytic subunit 3, chloroplastic [Tanacetum coccineum]
MSTILSESALEKALQAALELLKKAAQVLLKKAAEALKRHAGALARKLLAFALEKLAHNAEELSRKAAKLETAVGREVAKVAQAIADELYEMARKLKESLGKVELEQETQASESSEAELFAATYAEEEESVKSAIEEVERLLTELVKLKGHEVVDDHSYKIFPPSVSGSLHQWMRFFLLVVPRGRDSCMPTSGVMTYDPSTTWKGRRKCNRHEYYMNQRKGVSQGQVSKIISRVSGTPLREADTGRDYFVNAWQAKAYGLVEEVIDDGKLYYLRSCFHGMTHCKEQRAGLGLWSRDPLFVHPSWFGLMARKRLKKQNCCKVSKNYLSIPLEGSRKALKNMPSEDKILQNGRIGGEDGDGQKTEEAASA